MSDSIITCLPNYETAAFTCADKTISFDVNPYEAVEYWQEMLQEDVGRGATLNEYRLWQFFQRIPQQKRNEIAQFIWTHKKTLSPDFFLEYPPGKICLATEKDALPNMFQVYPRPNVSARHLIVLVYSLLKKEDSETNRQAFTPIPQRPFSLNNISGRTVFIGRGEKQIEFILPPDANIRAENMDKIYDVVNEFNAFIPEKPVKKVYVATTPGGSSSYETDYHYLTINLNNEIISSATHEMGHAIFQIKVEGLGTSSAINSDKIDILWKNIYYLTLGFNNYELIDDSNYRCGVPDLVGHPFDNPSELFASALTAYRLYPETFLKNITDQDNSSNTKKVGRLIFIYLRDRVFGGSFFSSRDPFAGETVDSLTINNEEVIDAFNDVLNNGGSHMRRVAIDMLSQAKLDYIKTSPALVDKIVELLSDPDDFIRMQALASIYGLQLNDERVLNPIFKALADPFWMIRKEAVKALGFLKIKDQRFIKGLTVMAVSDKDSDVRVNTIRVLGNLGFEPVIILGVLIQGLSDKSYNVSQEAAKSIGATKSDLFLAPLIYLLQDEVEVVNNLVSLKAAAATALGELGDKRALSALKEAAERYAGVREIAAAVRRAINKIQRITT